jgi:hypothetical protein
MQAVLLLQFESARKKQYQARFASAALTDTTTTSSIFSPEMNSSHFSLLVV